MKQLFFYFLLALCCINIKVKAQSCSLDQVGTTTVSTTSALADMAIDASNKVYSLAFNGATKIIELKSATISSSWTLVATVPTVTNTTVKPALAINKIGEIIAFIRDEPNGKVGKVYKSTGGAFTQIGGAISTGPVSDLSIAFSATNEIYIAYTDVTPSNLATVKRWSGAAWVDVGTGGIASTGASKFNSLIIDNTNTPILAYQDGDVGFATTVSKYNGTSWSPFFTSASGPTSNTTLRCATNGDYYVGYIEGSDASVVQKYDGSSWNQLGFNITGLSSGAGNYEMAIDPANSPYIIATTTSSMVTAYRFDGGTSWLQVPAGFINTNISTMVNMAFDKFGAPYFGYVDVPNNNALNVKTLTSLVSIITQPNSTTLCDGNSGIFSVTTGGPGSPTYNWQSNSSSGFLDVVVPYTPSSNILSVIANPTVNQDKIRCVVDIGCRNVISNTATLTVSSPSIASTSTNPTCFNSNNGAITTTVSGGVTPYSYSWNTGATTSSITSLFWNTYTLTVFDNAGCTASSVFTLTSPPSINSSFSGNMNICLGSNTTLTVTATGGVGAFTYNWTPSGSLSAPTSSVVIATPGSTQTYNVSITDALGCVATNTVMVNVNSVPTLTASASLTSICNGNSTNLSVTGTGADTYVWNPGNLAGASHIVSPTSTTIYTVVGTNTLTGCSTTANVTITVNPLPTVNAGPTRTLTCANTSTTLAGSTTGGVTFNWIGPGIVSGGTTLNPTINAPGTYDLSVVSAAGCGAGPSPVIITQNITPPSPTASTSGTLTCSTLTVALNGAPGTGVTYQWTGPGFSGGTTSQNAIANAAGSFTLRVTSSINGCTNTAVTNVTQNTIPPNPNATASGTISCITTTVSLNALPASGVTYTWTGPGSISGPNTQTPVVNAGGIYTLSITSISNGCSNTFPLTVNSNTVSPTVIPTMSGSLTCVTNTITAYVTTTTTPVTYNWTGTGILTGATTATITTNSTGIKNYLVTNTTNGCSTYSNVVVVQNTVSPTLSTSNGAINCYASTTTAGVGTAASPVTYTWSGVGIISASNISTITVNQGGTYGYSVTNTANGCVTSNTLSVATNTVAPSVTSSVSNTISCLTPTANAIVTTTASPVTYTWSGTGIVSGATTASPVVNTSGIKSYTVTTTTNGCSSSGTVNVIQNITPPTATASNSSTLTCSTTTASLFGTGGGTYNWSGPGILSGSTTASPIINLPGCYNLTVTAVNGCIATATTCVTQNIVIPTVSGGVSGTLTCVNPTVNATSSTTTTPVSYNWSGTGITGGAGTATITVNQSGIFSYTVTNTSNGCNSTGTRVVSQNTVSPLGVNAGTDQIITCSVPSVSLSGSVSSPTNALFNWSGGVCGSPTSSVTTACSANIYTLTVTNPANGCSGSDAVQVNLDIAVPSVSLSSNTSTITCFTPTVSVVATTTVGSVSYNWMPAAGTVGGSGSTNTPYFNSAGSYSLVVTNFINGCSTSISANIVDVSTDNAIPIITVSASSSVICSGNSSSLSASANSDPNTNYVWNPGTLNGANQSVSPLSSTSYSVVATNTVNGCANTETVNITVNSSPALSISGNTNICKGSTSIITGNGATSYTWNTGANTTSISVSPTITTTYTLNGDNGNGCASSLPITVSIISNKSISGVITSTAGATTGDVILYKYTIGLSKWDSITIVPFSSSYSFANIDSALYVVRAIPTATNIQVTYGDNAITWQNATVINHGCSNNSLQNIGLLALETFTPGPGVLSGTILEEDGFGQKISNEFKPLVPGQPIGGIIVKGGRNPGGQMLVQTLTNAAGQYTLSGLPLNSVNESYFVFVDIPGLDTNGTYHVVVSTTDTIYNGLNFTVDSMHINPIDFVTSVNSQDAILKNNIFVYPNPSRDDVTIKYELSKPSKISIDLYNLMGEKTQVISPLIDQEKGKFQHSINLKEVSNGIYLIKFSINNNDNYIKLIKTD